jgi:hypothetical protein
MVKQPVHVALAMLALALGSFGCDPPPELSDERQYHLRIDLGQPLGLQSHHALVGSTFFFEVVEPVGGEVDRDGGGIGSSRIPATRVRPIPTSSRSWAPIAGR